MYRVNVHENDGNCREITMSNFPRQGDGVIVSQPDGSGLSFLALKRYGCIGRRQRQHATRSTFELSRSGNQ